MEHVDVAVVGGGPAGASAAHAAAEAGASAAVFEKGVPRADREGLGPDSTDAAGILDYWVDIMDIHPDEFPDDVLLSELDRAAFVGPNESCVLRSTGIGSSYDAFGYTFHRAKFDDWLRERAEAAGADYRVGVSVKDAETDLGGDPRHTLRLASGDAVSADFLILADGPQRTVTNRVLDRFLPFPVTDHLGTTTANHIAYQEHRRLPAEIAEDLRGAITFWWGHIPGHTAYPWIFPNDDDVARIGLTMPIGLDVDAVADRGAYPLLRPDDETVPGGSEYLRRLLEHEYGDEYDVRAPPRRFTRGATTSPCARAPSRASWPGLATSPATTRPGRRPPATRSYATSRWPTWCATTVPTTGTVSSGRLARCSPRRKGTACSRGSSRPAGTR